MSDQFDPYHVWLGIPPEESAHGGPNHYRLLGLRLFEADGEVISNALDQRMAHLKTLQAGKRGALSQKLLNEVSAAGVALLDPKRKRDYDQQLRARQPAEKPAAPEKPAATPARKTALPTARALEVRALESRESVAAVMPLPAPAPPQHVPARAAPDTSAFGSAASANSPLSLSPAASQPARTRSGGGLAIAIVAGCALVLLVTVGVVAWMLRPPAQQPEVASHVVQPQPPVTPEQPPISTPVNPPVEPPPDPPTVPSVRPTPPVGPTPPVTPSPAPAPPVDDGRAWVYADNARGGLRRVSADRWVELTEDQATWYRQVHASQDEVLLEQLGGSPTQVKLLADRLERRNAEVTGTTVFYGKWRPLVGLPPFARRDPGSEQPLAQPNRALSKLGLLFDGRSQLELPVPEELRAGGQPFTIEMCVRWSDPSPQSCLLECGDVRLTTASSHPGHSGEGFALSSGGKQLIFGWKVPFGSFVHIAVTSDGQDGALVVNGMVDERVKLPDLAALGSGPLRLGLDSRGQAGFRGVLRGLRISSVNRYPVKTLPPDLPKLLTADDQTLLAIDFTDKGGGEIQLAGTSPGTAKRQAAQWIHLGFAGEYAPELSPGRADLMRAFNPSKHTLEGRTLRTPTGQLRFQSPQGRNALLVPYLPPANYRFESSVTRTGGDGGLAIGLVLAHEPAMLLIDAAAGGARQTGLLTTGEKVLAGSTPPTNLRLFTPGGPRRLACEVLTDRGVALVRVLLDDQLAYEWKGPIESAPLADAWQLPARTMFVGSRDATFEFNGMSVTPLPPPPSGALASGSTIPAATPPTPPAARRKPPDAATLAAELAKAREIYEDELKKATKPEQKAVVARNILKVGQETRSDATARYVLIDLARKILVQAGEVKEALAAAAVLDGDFELPPDELTIATLEALEEATLVGEQRALLATAAIDLAEELLAADQFQPAGKLATLAVQAANKQRDADLKKDVLQRKTQLGRIVAASLAVEESLKTLAQMPDDPAANLAVGKFRCLVLEDWEQGLPNLARTGETPLAAAAGLDAQSSLDKPETLVAAAEAWLAVAAYLKTGDRDQRQAIQRRAKSLLVQAQPKLTGLDKVKVEKKLEELKDVAAAASSKRGRPGSRRAVESPGLIGRVLVRNRDAGLLVYYQTDYTLAMADFEKLRVAAGVQAGDAWTIRFVGQLTLPVDSRVEVWHAGGSASGGVHSLHIDAKEVSTVGDDRTKNTTRAITLAKGPHQVIWQLSGGEMGTATIRLTPLNPDGSRPADGPKVMVPRELDAAMRQAQFKQEFRFGS